MKAIVIIAIIAAAAIALLDLSGAIPKSSVGGPMTIFMVSLAALLAYGLYEAWSQKRGVLGGLVSVVVALVGGVIAGLAGSFVMDMIMPLLQLDGPLAESQHPMRYLAPAVMVLIMLFGSSIALQVANRMR